MNYKNKFQPTLREPKDVNELFNQLVPKLLDIQREFQAIQNNFPTAVAGRSISGLSSGGGSVSVSSDIYRASTFTISTPGSNVIPFSSAIPGTYIIVQCILILADNSLTDLITKTSAQTASNFTVDTGPDIGQLRYAILIVN